MEETSIERCVVSDKMGRKRGNKVRKLSVIPIPPTITASRPQTSARITWANLMIEVLELIIDYFPSDAENRRNLLNFKLVNPHWNEVTNYVLGKRCVAGLKAWDPHVLHWRPDNKEFYPLFIPRIKLSPNCTEADVDLIANIRHVLGTFAGVNYLFRNSVYIYEDNQGESASRFSLKSNSGPVVGTSKSIKGNFPGQKISFLSANLSSLVLYGVKSSPDDLKTVLGTVENLRTLVIMKSCFIMDESQYLTTTHESPKLPCLSTLIVKNNIGRLRTSATQNCICMWLLNSYGSSITHLEFDGAPDAKQKHLLELEQLKVIGLHRKFIWNALSTDKLRRLSILKVNNITVKDFEAFINRFGKLTDLHLDLDTVSSMDVSSIVVRQGRRLEIRRNENQIMLPCVISFGCPYPRGQRSAALLQYFIAKFPALEKLNLIQKEGYKYSDKLPIFLKQFPKIKVINTFKASGNEIHLDGVNSPGDGFLSGSRAGSSVIFGLNLGRLCFGEI